MENLESLKELLGALNIKKAVNHNHFAIHTDGASYDDSELKAKIALVESKLTQLGEASYDDSAIVARVEALEARTDSDTIYNDSELKAEIAELKEKVAVLEDNRPGDTPATQTGDKTARRLYGIKAIGNSYFDTGVTLDVLNVDYGAQGYVEGKNPGALVGAYASNTARDIIELMGKSRKIQMKFPKNTEFGEHTIDLNAPMWAGKRKYNDNIRVDLNGGENGYYDLYPAFQDLSDTETTYQFLPLLSSGAQNCAVFMSGSINKGESDYRTYYPCILGGEICLFGAWDEKDLRDALDDIRANGLNAKYENRILRGAGEAMFAEVVAPE